MNDDNFKEKTLSWLSDKAHDWFVACVVYDRVLYPNFQFWKHKVRNENVLNTHIVIPPGSDEKTVKEACYRYLKSESQNQNLQIVTAFEKEENREDYDFGRSGKRWQLLINKVNKVERFSDLSSGTEDGSRYDHNLGFESLEKGQAIPDSWFGNEDLVIQIGKEIWALDSEHRLIWHPYVEKINDTYHIEIYLTRRFPLSKDYIELSKKILRLVSSKLKSHLSIILSVEFRDSMKTLVFVDYLKSTDLVTYKDEYIRKSRRTKYTDWMKN